MAIERVVLIEDHELVLEGLVAVLAQDERVEVIGVASSIEDFRRRLGVWDPTVIVADYRLPDGNGTDVVAMSESPVLILTGLDRPHILDRAVQAGCAGLMSKGVTGSQLADAIIMIGRGASVFPANAFAKSGSAGSGGGSRLTDREHEVLALLARPLSATEIATELDISLHTARNHIKSILAALGASSQLHAVVLAVRAGMIEIDG